MFAVPYRVERHFAAGLEYLTVEPPDLPPDAELPMVVYLHGRGGVPTPPQDGPYLGLDVPVRLILPRAPEPYGEGYAWMPVSAHDGETPALTDAIVDRGDLLAEALLEWRRRHPTRGAPLVVGFSQGGILAVHLATTHPDAVGAVFPMAGWLPPSLMPTAGDRYTMRPPIRALHGAEDRVLDPRRSAALFRSLRDKGYQVSFDTVPRLGHEVNAAMETRLRRLLEAALQALPESGASAGVI